MQGAKYFLTLALKYSIIVIIGKGDYVWVVKGDKVNSVPVKLGEQRNNQIEIVEGITENDLVVLTRQRFLSENSTVTIQK